VANALLDFVMSLVRDPDAAARYAADPARALADAHLTDVTSADVQNLIPVVSESLSMAVPSHTWDDLAPDPAANVWASGAATAAFDAFDDQLPEFAGPAVPVIVDTADLDTADLGYAGVGYEVLTDADLVDVAPSLQLDEPAVDVPAPTDGGLGDDWAQPVAYQEPAGHDSGFDILD
jgi:hypothetical protein